MVLINPYGNKDRVNVHISISPWLSDKYQTLVLSPFTRVGDIVVYYKQTGKNVKIRDLSNYALFKTLETYHKGSNISGSSSKNNSNNSSNTTSTLSTTTTSSSSTTTSSIPIQDNNESTGHYKKKRFMLSNEQVLATYNIENDSYLELLQINNELMSYPRWYYKSIVPSNQLEPLLRSDKTAATATTTNTNGTTAVSGKDGKRNSAMINSSLILVEQQQQQLLSTSIGRRKLSQPWQFASPNNGPLSSSTGSRKVYEAVQKIEYQIPSIHSRLDSFVPEDKWTVHITSSDDLFLKRLQMEDSLGSELTKQEYIDFSLRFENRTSMVLGAEHSILIWIDPIQSFFTLPFSSNTTVHDAIFFIVQYIYPTTKKVIHTSTYSPKPAASSPSSFPLSSPASSISSNSSGSSSSSSGSSAGNIPWGSPPVLSQIPRPNDVVVEFETFVNMVGCYGLYLQSKNQNSSNPLLPLQHKQLLLSCKLNNNKLQDSIFIFKAKPNKTRKLDNSISREHLFKNNNGQQQQPVLTSPRQLQQQHMPSISISNDASIDQASSNAQIDFESTIDEDEGYNLTVLFPTHQTYRQFHFNPYQTVNETIQSIITATTANLPLNSPLSPLSSTPTPTPSPTSTATTMGLLPTSSSSESINTLASPLSPTLQTPNRSPIGSRNNSHLQLLQIQQQQQQQQQQQLQQQQSPITNLNSSTNDIVFDKYHTIFHNVEETLGNCLFFQKNGSGVWMEGNRTLISYNLPNEAVVEFKPPPSICKMALVEGIHNTMKLLCNLQTYQIIYGRYTLISDLRELIIRNCSTSNVTEKELEHYDLFLVKETGSQCLNDIDSFDRLDDINPISDFLEFKASSTLLSSAYSNAMMQLAFIAIKDPTLIPGENIIHKREGERISTATSQSKKGNLFLTNFRLIFIGTNRSSYDDFGTKDDCDIPITTISKLKISNNQTEVFCKDFRLVIFQTGDLNIWEQLKGLMEFTDISKTFAFSNAQIFDQSFDTVYNLEDEFIRLQFPLDKWRITYINQDYSLCPTYPSLFIVPATVTEEDLKKIATFREKGRVPAICWIHGNHNSTITRCSQPRVGIFKSKCNEDEEYLSFITQANSNSSTLYVMDSRPMANAKANTLMGKGHEDTSLYQNVELQFLGIGNIHVMRDAYKKLTNIVHYYMDSPNWLSLIDGTQWLEHIFQLINSANMVVELVDKKGSSVLTHCSDGWDRTSQLVALSQLLLDPYYRTYKGFQILIEKEWLSFGHQFNHRCGHVTHANGDEETSPIFLMFIDSVWQLINLFPTTFQFNERFLIEILENVYSCKYGTFLFNNQREKLIYAKKYGGLVSLWSALNSQSEPYINYFYIMNPKPIYHNFLISDIQFWSNYYLRWRENYKPKLVIDANIVKEVENNHFGLSKNSRI